MAEDAKQNLVVDAVGRAAKIVADNLEFYDEILKGEREAGLSDTAAEIAAREWVRTALELWHEFKPK